MDVAHTIIDLKRRILGLFILTSCSIAMTLTNDYKNTQRLNEHKRLLIAQQEQINQLILNAEYNKIRYEQKQNR